MNKINPQQRKQYLSDDLMVAARPWHWQDFWNAERCSAIRRLRRELNAGVRPKVSLFLGPKGSGKTSASKILGMDACCESPMPSPSDLFAGTAIHPCGRCDGCHMVFTYEGIFKFSYLELNGADGEIGNDYSQALKIIWTRKQYGNDCVPYLVVIDEAACLPQQLKERLMKDVEETSRRARFILITREAESSHLPLPLLDRAASSTYHFSLPTPEEAAIGLRRVSQVIGLDLKSDAACWIAERFKGVPRACLGALNFVRPYGPEISLEKVQDILQDVGSDL